MSRVDASSGQPCARALSASRFPRLAPDARLRAFQSVINTLEEHAENQNASTPGLPIIYSVSELVRVPLWGYSTSRSRHQLLRNSLPSTR